MSEDRARGGRPDDADLFGQLGGAPRRRTVDAPGGAPGPNPGGDWRRAGDPQAALGSEPDPMPDPIIVPGDEERALRRQHRRRQVGAEGNPGGNPGGGGGGLPPGRGGALPALRPEMRPDTPALRAERVEAIRRDLVRRRRRKGVGMVAKLVLFVVLPTVMVAWFLWVKATPLYASDTVFLVQGAEQSPSGGGGILGALGGGRGGSGVSDSVAVQSFILSRDVLKRLEADEGIIRHFQNPAIDRLHRLDPNASFEAAYSHYQRMVSVSFDPSEGVLEMRLIATSAADAQRFSQAIIGYAEQMVDTLSDPIRRNAVADAERNLAEAEATLKAAQRAAADVRKKLATFSVEAEVTKQTQIISGMEVELEGLRGKLTNLRRVTGESDPRVQRLTAQVETLTAQIAARNRTITGSSLDQVSLADINAEIERANFEVQAAMAIFSAAIEAREISRKDAARQHRYLAVVVEPSVPDRANYPSKWQTTGLAFLICLGVYILASLTISLIREQASV